MDPDRFGDWQTAQLYYARWQAARLYWRADGRLTPATIRAATPPDVLAQDAALRRMHTEYHRRRRL